MFNVYHWRKCLILATCCNLVNALIKLSYSNWDVKNLCCVAYVFSCFFRACFPVIYNERVSLLSGILNTAFIGRLIANLGEIACGFQMYYYFQEQDHVFIKCVSSVIPIIVALSNTCCWIALLTMNYFYNIIEELGWTLIGLIVTLFYSIMCLENEAYQKHVMCSLLYTIYMLSFDVPLQMSHYEKNKGQKQVTVWQGVQTSFRTVVNSDLPQWRSEMVWQSLYFVVASYIMIIQIS